jgi:predicted oxidoreductase
MSTLRIAIGVLMAVSMLRPVFADTKSAARDDADILVVGAGIAGLSAALEAATHGAHVNVIDMSSVFGGHAVMSEGDVTIINTPLQRAKGVHDSYALAYKDFVTWGKDADADWVRYYAKHSRSDIYDWLTPMGVQFDGLRNYPGNSVPRAHMTRGRGLGLVSPLYRECLESPNIAFTWNTEVVQLQVENGRVVGLQVKNLRTGQTRELRAHAVILATGGFQSNLALVRKYWPQDLPAPERLLAGSGINSTGSGLAMATKAGAALVHLDHQWNYERGLPDPRYPGENRGLNATVQGVQVNEKGALFWPAHAASDVALRAVLDQPGATYWSIFDEKGKHTFWIAGSNWGDFETIQRVILDNDDLVKKATTIDELAMKTGLPVAALRESLAQTNTGSVKIDSPPFYAVQFFPLTRKSMGGIAIDPSAHVLDKLKHPIPGLYAAGEATGEAGINGKAALEGTFLGPAVVTARIAGRAAVSYLHISVPKSVPTRTADMPLPPPTTSASVSSEVCTVCHDLASLTKQSRQGYWHFERAHRVVLERSYQCAQCHTGIGAPDKPENHRVNRMTQINSCAYCHVSQ